MEFGRQFDPKVDWRETPEKHIFKADMPGLKKEEVRVQLLDGRNLKIDGEWIKEEVHKGDIWHCFERSNGNFSRRFRLPENSNVDQVHTQLQDGVLTVEIPKVQQLKPRVRRIEIS